MCDLDHEPYLTFGEIQIIACEDVPHGFFGLRRGQRYTHIGRMANDGITVAMVAPI